jgi:cobalamin biosynthesis protein CobD/CbiB
MVILSASFRGFTYLFRYGHHHTSPNSGFPESALAGILHVRLGGPNTYGGILVEKPYIGDNARTIRHADITKACLLNGVVSIIAVGLITWLLPCHCFSKERRLYPIYPSVIKTPPIASVLSLSSSRPYNSEND